MSQFTYEPIPAEQSNGLAIAGFVCSLLGFFTGFLLSPIGLILSLVALGRPGGRGLAIAGVVIGLLGSCGAIVACLLIAVLGIGAVLAAVGFSIAMIAMAEPEKLELTSDMINIAIAAKMYEDDQGVLPADLGLLKLRETLRNDPWGNPYEYHFIDQEPGFDIISWGQDGESGTEDDVYLTRLDETWEAAGNIVVDYDEKKDGGTITFNIGDRTITAHGDEKGGRITIDLGDRIIELTGDEDGGHITVHGPDDEKSADEPPTEETPPDTSPDDEKSAGSGTEGKPEPGD